MPSYRVGSTKIAAGLALGSPWKIQVLSPQGGRCCKAPGFQMNFDYLRLCSRASDNPGFIWFCGFPSIAGRLLCDYLGEPLHDVFMKANAPRPSREGRQLFFFFWFRGASAPQNLCFSFPEVSAFPTCAKILTSPKRD